MVVCLKGLLRWLSGKESACQCRGRKRHGFDPWARKIPPEKEMATHSGILDWEIPWAEESGELQSVGSMGLQRAGHEQETEHAYHVSEVQEQIPWGQHFSIHFVI